MKLLIHALGVTMGGAMRHLTNFLPALAAQDTSNEYRILVRHGFPELFLPDNIRLERVPDEAASHWGRRLTLDIIQLPRKLSRERFDAIVSLTNFGPIWSPVPHIFFQRNPLYYCSHYLATVSGKEKYETLMRRWLAMASMKRAALVVTPSNAMAEMIKETCPQVRKRPFRTLYHGYSKDSLTEPLESRYGEKLAVTGYKLLYPTHPATHKGFEILFEIVELLKAEGLDFTLFTTISREDWPQGVDEYSRMIRERGLGQHVVFMGRVPQSQMGALYERCDLMVYPSLCESLVGLKWPPVMSSTRRESKKLRPKNWPKWLFVHL